MALEHNIKPGFGQDLGQAREQTGGSLCTFYHAADSSPGDFGTLGPSPSLFVLVSEVFLCPPGSCPLSCPLLSWIPLRFPSAPYGFSCQLRNLPELLFGKLKTTTTPVCPPTLALHTPCPLSLPSIRSTPEAVCLALLPCIFLTPSALLDHTNSPGALST